MRAPSPTHLANTPSEWPWLADLTGDGRAGLIFMSSGQTPGLLVCPSTPMGCGPPQQLAMRSQMDFSLTFGDLDGDGHTDLVSLIDVQTSPTSFGPALETIVLNPADFHSW